MKLLKSTGIRQSVFTVIGNLMGTGIAAIAVILLIRILGPEKYAEFSVGFAIVLMLTRLNDLGLNPTIVKFASELKTNSEKNFIYNYALKYKLLVSTIIILLGVFFYKPIAEILKLNEPLIILLSFSFGLATVYYEYLLSIFQSLHSFGKTVLINTIQAIVKLLAVGTLFFIGSQNILPAYFWYIFATFIPVFFARKLLPDWFKIDFNRSNKKLQKKILSLASHASIGLIAAGIIENIDILFVQKYLTAYETGLYGGISRIALFFAIVAYSLGNVLNARASKYKSKEHISAFLKKSFILSALIILSFALFVPLANPLIFYSIGAEFLSGNLILIILTAGSFFALAAIPFIAIFFALEANWYFSVSGILQLIIVLTGNFMFVPEHGLIAAAWTRFATRLFLLLFTVISSIVVYKKQYGKVAA
ncbi:MAG: oligosaccharide flippase family protein [Candidatus Pacebacteria bacterium]|jgi:O-antigen/teichoic acid export membrane protein|nr:oligosaccharide flippase family protein [Candidatus Paceibacterota bacterium]MBT6756070.1 oligosaccharide flippase family protein [Candidatus Paceibacterota bacterium]